MKPRDPRIVGGGHRDLNGEKMALEQIQMENAIRSNPLFPIVAEVKKQNVQILAQNRSLIIKLQSLMDYLAHIGILLHQDMDEEGIPTTAPRSLNYQLFEKLVAADIGIDMPTYGFSTYYVEHSERTVFLIEMMQQVQKRIKTMDEVIEMVRNYNARAGRVVPIAGVEFGLDGYLSHNPDDWDDEKLDAVATEFGLQKEKEKEEEPNEGEESEKTEGVSSDQGAEGEEDNSGPAS